MTNKRPEFKQLLLRLRGDLTYREVEELTGVSYGAYWNWEMTGKVPREVFLRQIADGFKVPRARVFEAAGLGTGGKEDEEWDEQHYPGQGSFRADDTGNVPSDLIPYEKNGVVIADFSRQTGSELWGRYAKKAGADFLLFPENQELLRLLGVAEEDNEVVAMRRSDRGNEGDLVFVQDDGGVKPVIHSSKNKEKVAGVAVKLFHWHERPFSKK